MSTIEVLIIGAGIGGLSCAIGCRRQGLKVTVLERDARLSEWGAGIQLPPNAARVMHSYGLLASLIEEGSATCNECIHMHRYDGELLTKKPLRLAHWLDFDQYTIHRIDYQKILAEEAQRAGAQLRFGCKIDSVACTDLRPHVTLEDGETLTADVIIGADGMFSAVRKAVLQQDVQPVETGDLAWRATITREQIAASGHAALIESTSQQRALGWLGPGSHVGFYPLREGSQYNLVLARPDDLPASVVREQGDLADLRAFFADWDPMLNAVLSQVSAVQKWKLLELPPLDTWTRGATALVGDACHPTLPYQAQGAAMAVEDGATLATLLGLIQERHGRQGRATVPRALRLYEDLRKQRTELNVRGANSNRTFLHMPRGAELEQRDRTLRTWDWEDLNARSEWPYLDPTYAKDLMGFRPEAEARKAFEMEFGPASAVRSLSGDT